jgi:hypothetical protein
MGGHAQGKAVLFQWSNAFISCHIEGAAPFACTEVNGSLSMKMTGNNSGALLLTILRLIDRTGNELFTSGGRFCAFVTPAWALQNPPNLHEKRHSCEQRFHQQTNVERNSSSIDFHCNFVQLCSRAWDATINLIKGAVGGFKGHDMIRSILALAISTIIVAGCVARTEPLGNEVLNASMNPKIARVVIYAKPPKLPDWSPDWLIHAQDSAKHSKPPDWVLATNPEFVVWRQIRLPRGSLALCRAICSPGGTSSPRQATSWESWEAKVFRSIFAQAQWLILLLRLRWAYSWISSRWLTSPTFKGELMLATYTKSQQAAQQANNFGR